VYIAKVVLYTPVVSGVIVFVIVILYIAGVLLETPVVSGVTVFVILYIAGVLL
jgi:hypothetical protein